MNFDPSSIWSWYKKRPTWLKVILFIFIVLLLLLAVIGAILTGRRVTTGGVGAGPDPLQTGKDGAEKHFWNRYQDTLKRDEKIGVEIKGERDEQGRLEKEREDAAKKNQDDHDAIDNADSFGDVDSVLNRR